MKYSQAVKLEKRVFAQVFNRLPVLISRGRGVHLWDASGRRYLDFFSGVAVSSVGHAHPRVLKTIVKQASNLIHASNWVYTEPQLKLAKTLVKLTGMERVFYTNDGSGAVETALKLARKQTGRKGIISMENSFHGRTMGALSATWQKNYRKPFEPLVPGFKFAKYNNIESLRDSLSADTAAVIVEPIQGEAGVVVSREGYLKEVRELTDKHGALMIMDEVQTGFGRAGSWFEYKRARVKPDIVVLAKGLGGGFPIGATLYSGMDFETGQHGGTYNGSPLACAVASAVIDIIVKERLVNNARKVGEYLVDELSDHKVHGRGLMIGVDVDSGRQKALKLLQGGAIVIYSGNTLRLLPPLILNKGQADEFIEIFKEVL